MEGREDLHPLAAGLPIGLPRVSIAMATYDGGAFLAAQLDSLLAQTHQPDELVVCDDGSKDATVGIIADFAKRSPFPVRLHRNAERLGYRRNFIQAGQRCSGEVIFFCDQDDVWAVEKIASVLPSFSDPDVLLVYHNAVVFHEAEARERSRLYAHGEQERLVAPSAPDPFHFSLGFTQAYRKRLHAFDAWWSSSIDHLNLDSPLAHDQWFMFLARTMGRVCFVDRTLADHRQHQRNTYGVTARDPSRQQDAARDLKLDLRRAQACRNRATIIRAMARPGQLDPDAADLIAGRYLRFADYIERRCRCLTVPRRATRLREFALNLSQGAYHGSEPWRLPKRRLPIDLWRAWKGSDARVRSVPRRSAP